MTQIQNLNRVSESTEMTTVDLQKNRFDVDALFSRLNDDTECRIYLLPVGEPVLDGRLVQHWKLMLRSYGDPVLQFFVSRRDLQAMMQSVGEDVRVSLSRRMAFYEENVPKCFGSLSLDRPLVMGVVNVTPDSFSDGGKALILRMLLRRGRLWSLLGPIS